MGNTIRRIRERGEELLRRALVAQLVCVSVLYAYAFGVLAWHGVVLADYASTLVFALVLLGGLWLLAGAAALRDAPAVARWVAALGVALFGVWEWIWCLGIYKDLGVLFEFFPVTVALLYVWAGVLVSGVVVVLLYLVLGLLRVVLAVARRPAAGGSGAGLQRPKAPVVVMFLVGVVAVGAAYPLARVAGREGQIIRTVEWEDTNAECSLVMWDLPPFSAQVGSTQEIDLGLLSDEANRTLAAFEAMNTTFFAMLHIQSEAARNQSIATMKLLDAFGLGMVWTIWYTDSDEYPTAKNAEDWIGSARAALEFAVAEGLTNVVGIGADSEGWADVSAAEYYAAIGEYDEFLREVQTNASLAHPDPARGTFETVLTFAPYVLTDLLDGDTGMTEYQRKWGLPPFSWTQHHFMTYRQSNSQAPHIYYNYLVLMRETLGTVAATPIAGLAGVNWFAEGYFAGTAELFYGPQPHSYDGIDGWDALKREIFVAKAMGFRQVSVFKLNSYGVEGTQENYGLLDYYGVEALEDLAAEWNAPKTVVYPITSEAMEIGQRGMFGSNAEIRYDLLLNWEMALLNIIMIGAAVVGTVRTWRRVASPA